MPHTREPMEASEQERKKEGREGEIIRADWRAGEERPGPSEEWSTEEKGWLIRHLPAGSVETDGDAGS